MSERQVEEYIEFNSKSAVLLINTLFDNVTLFFPDVSLTVSKYIHPAIPLKGIIKEYLAVFF